MCATRKTDDAALLAKLKKWRQNTTTEDTVEGHLVRCVERAGGMALKFPYAPSGWPDRMVLLPGGVVLFFELKRPKGGRLEPLQPWWHAQLRKLGFEVHLCNTKAAVDSALEEHV